ncbi:PepSY-associated TM helix domain-containing protein [Undibacterium sp. TS12]|uniref:PepSY-associated TM helix domain-containing protein n=1 Tax=Undibacterium sp. TS12 TaxID=2908202 RepID=UPI001F4C91A6|nr:PepSY-associated TM helix domain-containing protein [Undibacterium sp. TS12]MCH8619887.1 PepSY domain-containing protein [Undibacterium sp. TS12]
MSVRPALVVLHRWFGLAAAIFLFIAGLTGALISWDHALDAWLNPQLFHAYRQATATSPEPMSGLELANRVEARDPRMLVTYVLTEAEPGHTIQMSVEGRLDPATGKPYELGFNQIAVNPFTADIQGKRQWGEISLSRENLLPFLYKLHYTMHIPAAGGVELGIWLMGLIGLVWVVDCFIALWLSFPNWSSWRKSFFFRWKQGGHKLNFDLHRSGGVWLWLFMLLLAITSVSMNLNSQVVRPVVALFSPLSEDVFASRTPLAPEHIRPVGLTREQIVALANADARQRGWTLPLGGVFYSPAFGVYGAGFFEAGNDHGDGGLGNAWLYFDAQDGRALGGKIPGTGSAGDIFLQAQFPLHSGRILGMPGRIMISLLGLVVAMLSLTGVIIWVRKRAARLVTQRRSTGVIQAQLN